MNGTEQLRLKLNQRVARSGEVLFELHIFEQTAGASDFQVALAFDLSIHRDSRLGGPVGEFQKWDWQVHAAPNPNVAVTDQLYTEVKNKCRIFMTTPPVKPLWLIRDDRQSTAGDPLYARFDADVSAGNIHVGREVRESVADYHYYRVRDVTHIRRLPIYAIS